MSFLLNRAKASTSTTGTGSVTPGAAVSPYQTWAAAGAATNGYYAYLIEDGTAWELGVGLYNGTTITRPGPGTDVEFESSTGSLLNLSGAATVACVANKNDYQPAYMCVPAAFDITSAQTLSFNSWFGRAVVTDRDAVVTAVNFTANAAQTGPVFAPCIYTGWVAGGALLGSGPTVTNIVSGINALPLTNPILIAKGTRILVGAVLTVANATVLNNTGALGSAYNGSTTTPPSTAPAFSGTNAINNANFFLTV